MNENDKLAEISCLEVVLYKLTGTIKEYNEFSKIDGIENLCELCKTASKVARDLDYVRNYVYENNTNYEAEEE